MRLARLVLALSAVLATPLAAQETFIWTYSAQFPMLRGDARLDLVATQPGALSAPGDSGLPGGLVWARCLSESDAGEVAIRVEMNANFLAGGTNLSPSLTLVGSNGETFTQVGSVENRNSDPVGGIEIVVPNDSAALRILTESDFVSYGVTDNEFSFIEFNLSTNRAYVAEFVDDCAAVGAGGRLQRSPDLIPVSADLVPDFGPAISGHVWGRFTQVSPDVTQTIVDVFYAVPETDDVLVAGHCFIGAQGPLAAFSASADIEGLAEGEVAVLRFTSGNGRSVDVEGSVVGTQLEIGIVGVEVVLEMSDPAWLIIAGDELLRIERVGGQSGFTLTGNGPNTIGTFLSDCDNIADLVPDDYPTPSAPIGAQPGFLTCEAFGRVSSRDTGAPIFLNIVNQTSGFRGLIWIDPNGQAIEMVNLNPGEEIVFNTDPGHVWMATNGPGDCLEMIQPEPGQAEYRLTVEN